jgi:MoaE-MoaD fusion protein
MHVTLRHFALMRETLGRSSETREVPPGTTAGQLLATVTGEEPRLAGVASAVMVMVNRAYVGPDHPLADGDEVAFIPPVSGGEAVAGIDTVKATGLGLDLFRITEDPLDVRAIEAAAADPAAGAVLTFTGVVRDHARGRGVVALDYESYAPAAEAILAQIGAEMRDRWDVARVAIVHRVGYLTVGEASVVIAVSAAHRDAAFAACRHAIERIKEIVPIWKKEHYADGAVWIGSEADYQRETGRLPR